MIGCHLGYATLARDWSISSRNELREPFDSMERIKVIGRNYVLPPERNKM